MTVETTHVGVPQDDVGDVISDLRVSCVQDMTRWLPLPTAFAYFYGYLLADHYFGFQPTCVLIIAALGVLTSLLAHRLSRKWVRQAALVYVLGLVVSILALTWVSFSELAIAFLPLIILITLCMVGPQAMLIVTSISSVEVVLAERYYGLWVKAPLWPLLILWSTALVAWLSHHGLRTAAEWAVNGYEKARCATSEARQHRGELVHTLKALDEAHYRLERYAEQLALARDAAEEARRAKQLFVANVSHELRTPLNIIIGFSEMLALSPESYGVEGVPQQCLGDIHRIYRSARHLKDLIDDVLDLSKVNAHHMPLITKRASLSEVVHEATSLVEPLAQQKGLEFIIEMPTQLPRIYFDRLRVRQVLLNLLNNAIRLTDCGSIRVSAVDHEQSLEVRVEDTGPGIPRDMQSTIFEEFQQLGPMTSRSQEGVGLGLALSRRFIELHGGRMWVESEEWKGSCFHFTLPIRVTPEGNTTGHSMTRTSPVRDQVSSIVLAVTEEPETLNLLKRHLQGYEVVGVSYSELDEALVRYLPKAVLLVDDPPEQLGAEATPGHAVAFDRDGEPRTALSVPMIACALPGQKVLARMLSVDHYLLKPVSRERILAVLSRYGENVSRVLVVDDDLQMATLLARTVSAAPRSYEVGVACGGEEGWARMAESPPDLVFLDLMMHDLSGIKILEMMRSDERLGQTAVTIVTARDLPADKMVLPGSPHLMVEGINDLPVLSLLRCVQGILDGLPSAGPRPLLDSAIAVDRSGLRAS